METILSIEEIEEGGMSGYVVKTNKQEIKLLIDSDQTCCEHWGYFWCNLITDDFVGSELLNVTQVDNCLNERIFKNEFGSSGGEVDDTLFINLETSVGNLQFVLFNSHNGYYGHKVLVNSTWVTIEETL